LQPHHVRDRFRENEVPRYAGAPILECAKHRRSERCDETRRVDSVHCGEANQSGVNAGSPAGRQLKERDTTVSLTNYYDTEGLAGRT